MTRFGMSGRRSTSLRAGRRHFAVELGDVTLTYHAAAAGTARREASSVHRVAVHVGPPHTLWERRGAGDGQVGAHGWGDVVVTARGERTTTRWDRDTRFVEVALASPRVQQAAAELDGAREPEVGRFSHCDPFLRDAVLSLLRLALSSGVEDALRRDGLVDAIAARLVSPRAPRPAVALAPAALRRVQERLHDELAEPHRSADLAALAGLSRFHFARQFRRATGLSPHAYLLEVRVLEAARLLATGADVGDVAAAVGFGSRAHLSRQLASRLSITPGALRGLARR